MGDLLTNYKKMDMMLIEKNKKVKILKYNEEINTKYIK